jgi:transcriptional regulator with XRE-family HTH domain
MPTGALVRLYRIQRRMRTVSLATHAGLTARYLEMIEAGSKTPSLPVLRKLARVLGVRTSALVGEAPSEAQEGPVNPRLAEVERALSTYRSLALTIPGSVPRWGAQTQADPPIGTICSPDAPAGRQLEPFAAPRSPADLTDLEMTVASPSFVCPGSASRPYWSRQAGDLCTLIRRSPLVGAHR